MSIAEQINSLLKKLPKDVSPETLAERTPPAEQLVTITGTLLGRIEFNLLVSIGETRLEIRIEDIVSIEENPSFPAVSEGGIYVDIRVKPTARIIERRAIMASQYGLQTGKRPFVYEMPSQAAEFAIPAEEFEAAEGKWLENVGLSDYASALLRRGTPYTSVSRTPYMKASTTNHQTVSFEPGVPTKIDSRLDMTPAEIRDYPTDYKQD